MFCASQSSHTNPIHHCFYPGPYTRNYIPRTDPTISIVGKKEGEINREENQRQKIWVLRNQAQGQKYSKQQVQKYTARQHRVIRVITPIGGKGIERIKQDKGDTKEPLEHRPVGTDHDRWFFRVWSGDFGDFTATLLQSLESCME